MRARRTEDGTPGPASLNVRRPGNSRCDKPSVLPALEGGLVPPGHRNNGPDCHADWIPCRAVSVKFAPQDGPVGGCGSDGTCRAATLCSPFISAKPSCQTKNQTKMAPSGVSLRRSKKEVATGSVLSPRKNAVLICVPRHGLHAGGGQGGQGGSARFLVSIPRSLHSLGPPRQI